MYTIQLTLESVKQTNLIQEKFMRLEDKAHHATLDQVIPFFLAHYKDEKFLDMVREHGSFNHTRDTGSAIAQKIINDESKVTIRTYTERRARWMPKWVPESACVAQTSILSKTISFNTRMLELPQDDQQGQAKLIDDRINTLMHEYIHTLGYTHKGNKNNAYNDETAPYKIGKLFIQYKNQISGQH